MKGIVMSLLLSCLAVSVYGQRITKSYRNMSMSEVLRDLNRSAGDYTINFMYNELEDFRVTTDIRRKTVPDALLQIIGFYPVRVVRRGKRELYVECTHKTDRHLTGNIINEQGRPVAYANIAVLNPIDSTSLCCGVSNESGFFAVPYEQERVLVRISYVGYETIYRLCEHPQMGTLRMQPETQQLKGVTVNGQVPVLHRRAGTIIFDTRHLTGAINATDLLRCSPGVLLNGDDITLFGYGGVIFCIDGKEQNISTQEMLQMLRSYPAEDVERIEITQAPSANHAAEGHAGVINLVLKKKSKGYTGGSMGYARNQNEIHGDEVNVSMVYRRGKLSTSLNVAGTWDNTRYRETNHIRFTDMQRSGTDNGEIGNDNYMLRWQADYNVTDKLNVGAYVMYADGKRRLAVDGLYDFLPKMVHADNGFVTQTNRKEDTKTWAANVCASQVVGNRGTRIDFDLDYYRMTMGDSRHSISNSSWVVNSPDEIYQTDTIDFDYRNHIAQTIDNYSAKVDVRLAGFRAGTQYAYTRSRRDLDYSGVGNNRHEKNTYDEQLWAGYAEYSKKMGETWTISLGARYEHVWTKVENLPAPYVHRTDYGRVFPTLHVGFAPRQDHSLTWSVNSRISRPNIININPNWVWRDVNHASFGNLNLKPSYLYKAMMGYTFKGVLSLDLYYTYEQDKVDAVYEVNKQVIYNSWSNITDAHRVGINTSYSFDRLSWMTATLIQGLWYAKSLRPEGKTALRVTRKDLYQQVGNVAYMGQLQANFFFDQDRKWTAHLHATYNSPEKDVARSLHARYRVDAGMQYRFWKERLTLGLSCRNLLSSHFRGTEYLGTTPMDFDNTFHYRQLRLTLSCQWGRQLQHHHRRYESDKMKERTVNDF